MNNPISGIKTSGENSLSKVTTTLPNPTKKADSPDPKSAPTQTKSNSLELSAAIGTKQPKTDTLELSAVARAKQTKTDAQLSAATSTKPKTQLSGAARAKQLQQQGQTVAQIAASLGVDVATVDGYLGISPTPAKSTSNSETVPQAAAPSTSPSKPVTVSQALASTKE